MVTENSTGQGLIRLAIQKNGRLSTESIELIRECGITFDTTGNKLKTEAHNFPLEILFLRDDDIPQYVCDGVADLGIVGENIIFEKRRELDIVEKLGFARCRLSLAMPIASRFKGLGDLNGLSIATSYPSSLSEFLKANGVRATVRVVHGSAEIAPGVELAQAICDLVSSGSTLLSHGLKEVAQLFKSEAVLVRTARFSASKRVLFEKLLFRIQSVKRARECKYVVLNTPNQAISKIRALLPGLRSPTVSALVTPGWSSLHSVIKESEFWEVIESLKAAGAEGILVMPIEKMIW